MSGLACFAAVTFAITTVSPYLTIVEAVACLATFPVSILNI